MNWNRTLRLQSFAQHFCTITLAVVFTNSALAEESPTNKERTDNLIYAKPDQCARAQNAADAAKGELDRACRESGLGSACISQIKKCAAAGEADEYGDDADLLVAFSNALGVPQNQVGSKCPKYSGQGYFERKDKYQNDLDDVNDKLSDLKKDLATLNKDFNKDVQDVQEEIAEAQKDLKQKSLDIKKEQRERATEQAKTAADLAKNLRAQQSLILQKRQEISNIYRSKNSSLIAMAESATKRACMKKVKELKKDYEAIAGGSSGSFITRASQKKQALQDEYDNCMLQFDQQRLALIEQTDQKVEQAQDAINNAQSDIDNMTQQLSTMNAQETEAKNDDNTAMSNETTALNEKITRATTKLQSLQQTTQQEAQALTEKQNYYKGKSTSLSNSIAGLGPIPSDETSTAKISQADSAYESYRTAIANVPLEVDGKECFYDRSALDPGDAPKNASIGGKPGKR